MRAARIAMCVSFTLLSACDSTGAVEPRVSPAHEAVRFDSILGAVCSRGDPRCFYLNGFAIPFAFGATPSAVQLESLSVWLDSFPKFKWQGFVYDTLVLNLDGSVRYHAGAFMLFSDTNLTSALVFKEDSLGAYGLPDWWLLRNNGTVDRAIGYGTGPGDTAVADLGNCATPPRLMYTALPTFTPSDDCRIRLFSVLYGVGFTDLNIDIPQQFVKGIQVVFRL
jgi:hypothetical protein